MTRQHHKGIYQQSPISSQPCFGMHNPGLEPPIGVQVGYQQGLGSRPRCVKGREESAFRCRQSTSEDVRQSGVLVFMKPRSMRRKSPWLFFWSREMNEPVIGNDGSTLATSRCQLSRDDSTTRMTSRGCSVNGHFEIRYARGGCSRISIYADSER